MPRAVKPGRWVFPDGLVIIREVTAVDFNLIGKMFDLAEMIRRTGARRRAFVPSSVIGVKYFASNASPAL